VSDGKGVRALAAVGLSLLIAGGACSDSAPKNADLSGRAVVVSPSMNRIGVIQGNKVCLVQGMSFAAPCYDYDVYVTGSVYQEVLPGKYERISVEKVPLGAPLLIWTNGAIYDTYPQTAYASRVIVQYEADVIDFTRKVRR
jgi:hypothetical protein